MRRSRRKLVSWLVLAVLSLGTLPGAAALDAQPATADCGMAMSPGSGADRADTNHIQDCKQHQACTAYCQFAPIPPSGLAPMQVGRRPLSPPFGETARLVSRCLDDIERHPRV